MLNKFKFKGGEKIFIGKRYDEELGKTVYFTSMRNCLSTFEFATIFQSLYMDYEFIEMNLDQRRDFSQRLKFKILEKVKGVIKNKFDLNDEDFTLDSKIFQIDYVCDLRKMDIIDYIKLTFNNNKIENKFKIRTKEYNSMPELNKRNFMVRHNYFVLTLEYIQSILEHT